MTTGRSGPSVIFLRREEKGGWLRERQ